MFSCLPVVALQAIVLIAMADECLKYSTRTVTHCNSSFIADTTTRKSMATARATSVAESDVITVTLPVCDDCGCTEYANKGNYSSTYVTVLDVACSTGIATTAYTVKEVYSGVTEKPYIDDRDNDLPPGFTSSIVTCKTCGNAGVTATITYPANGTPWQISSPPNNGTQGGHDGSAGNSGSNVGDTPTVVGSAAKIGMSAVLAVFVAVFLLQLAV